MTAGPILKLVEGGQAAKPKRPRARKTIWPGCHVCLADIGVRSRVVIRGISHPDQDSRGNITGGTKVLCCATCLARGKVTPVTT